MKRIFALGIVAALIAATFWGGLNSSLTRTVEAHGTCSDHYPYKVLDGTHDRDGDGVGCESNPRWPSQRSGSTTERSTETQTSGYDRDNWDYNSSQARSRLGCNSSEHVDHIVALKEAYDSGASGWSNSRKSQFANDPLNQWCLAASIISSKSDGDLAEWRGGSCAQRKYIARITVQVKQRYALSIDAAEQRAINSALAATCAAAVTAPSTAAASSGVGRTQPSAGTTDRLTGQIVARRLAGGGTEFGFQPTGGTLALPQARFFPADARVGRWLSSSPVVVDGVEIGRISARLLSDGRIEFAFAPTNAERILPRGRYFPPNAVTGRWLRSSAIDVGG